MTSITSTGIGSGLDVNGLVSKVMAAEQAPMATLTARESAVNSKISAFGQIKNSLTTLQSAVEKLGTSINNPLTPATVSSSDSTQIDATLVNANAQPGAYEIEVKGLATVQRIATSSTAEPAITGDGILKIKMGSFNQDGIFTETPDTVKTIDFKMPENGSASLQDIANAINNVSGINVRASVINTGTLNQLVIASKQTGTANAFILEGSDGLSSLTYDNKGDHSNINNTDSFTALQSAKNAELTVNGISVSRSKNDINDVIYGVNLNLKKTTLENPTTITIAEDVSTGQTNIENLVKAYNDTISVFNSLSKYDPVAKKGAVLNGDSTIRSITQALKNSLSQGISELSGAQRLSDIGITFNSSGQLSINKDQLSAAMKDPTKNVSALFSGTGSVSGLSSRLNATIVQFTGAAGTLANRTETLNSSLDKISEEKDRLQTRLNQKEKQYTNQFTNLDSFMSKMNSTSSYLSSQLSSL